MTVKMNDATLAQVRAADPAASTWLTANAGSGKTRVLTDRVAWMLLEGVPPERILCLTFTKAAASEMQNRLFLRLGQWAMLGDEALSAQLEAMGVPAERLDPARLRQARTLFARAIEAPGGLKIQTIHAFAASILRRFPLEAQVSPGFQEIEERAQVILMDQVLDALAEGPHADAIAGVAPFSSGDDLRSLMSAVLNRREAFTGPMPDYRAWLGLGPGDSEDSLIGQVFTGEEADLCAIAASKLNPATRGNPAQIATLRGVPFDAPRLRDVARLEGVFLTGATAKAPFTAKIGTFANKAVRAALGNALPALEDFMQRLEDARPTRLALMSLARTEALQAFARAFIPAYDAAKEARGYLDFNDLIRCTKQLLTDRAIAPWVLFRLDGGIDHLLVDEAQDTSPAQWDIVRALAEEFAAGQGARDETTRTLFVVGDVKQSIYSFQGADPAGFERMRGHFEEQLSDAPAPLSTRELIYSFRSAPLILSLVDAVARADGVGRIGDDIRHEAFHGDLPGRVDIWPVIPKSEKDPETQWSDPVDLRPESAPDIVMAKQVAEFIAEVLENPPLIRDRDGPRPVGPGDILILLRRRKLLFNRIIQEIKARDLPILGADRFEVTQQLAVRDLVAMLKVLATRADDLSLATVLRSPLFGWDDDALFRLAHARRGSLWQALEGRPEHDLLRDLRRRAGRLRPYELLERALTHWGLRKRIVARLGGEAEDGVDALLAQALAYERAEVPSLIGFIEWLEADELQIKRDAGQSSGQIRVMTVHGAKGLEAPVVILPETAHTKPAGNTVRLVQPEDGPIFWAASKAEAPEDLRAAMEAEAAADEAERARLLYVAMTRAAQWLVVGAAGEVETKTKDAAQHSWYGAIAAAARDLGAIEIETHRGCELRLQSGDWASGAPVARAPAARPALPDWTARRAPKAESPAARTPSSLGGAKVLPGDSGGQDEVSAKRHGRLIHLLLEHLPALDPQDWAAAAPGILRLDGPEQPDATETRALLDHAGRVLRDAQLAHLFAGEALAEVSLTARSATLDCQMIGQIDRLILSGERVLAVDFKTNALVPDDPGAVPEGLLRQMGAYAEMLMALYPGHRVETAILWTAAPRLMSLPHDAVMAALAREAAS